MFMYGNSMDLRISSDKHEHLPTDLVIYCLMAFCWINHLIKANSHIKHSEIMNTGTKY